MDRREQDRRLAPILSETARAARIAPPPWGLAAPARIVLVLCFGVPLVFACSWGWAAIGLAPLVAFCFLGVEAASIECERPFSGTPSKNHHDLERFAIAVSAEVEEMLRCAQRASKYAF